jgi:CheY-like chemotaxis protein
MQCPKCGNEISSHPDATGLFVCGSCGVKLRKGAPKAGEGQGEMTLERLFRELEAVRKLQEEILGLLRVQMPAVQMGEPEDEPFVAAPSVRARKRKSVIVIDDDAKARDLAVAALEAAEVPVRATGDGNGGIAAIAAERPDVIVLELALSGAMSAKDVINMIKATMEWIDIPIILYTSLPVASQKEARTVHGADEVVPKSGGPEALVAKVIALFRRG